MRHLKNLSLALLLSVLATVSAPAVEVIPTTGVEVDGWITAAITAMGGVVAVAVGGYFAFLIIKRALRWAGRAIG